MVDILDVFNPLLPLLQSPPSAYNSDVCKVKVVTGEFEHSLPSEEFCSPVF